MWLTIVFGICTVAGRGGALLQLMTHKKGSAVERAKAAAQLQRIEHAKFSAAVVHDTVHLAVQRAKEADSTGLADLLRVARGSLEVIIRELEDERLKLKSWRFGRIFESDKKVDVERMQAPRVTPEGDEAAHENG